MPPTTISAARSVPADGGDPERLRDALQLDRAWLAVLVPVRRRLQRDGAGKDLVRSGLGRDAGGRMDSEAGVVGAVVDRLGRVHADTDARREAGRPPMLGQSPLDGDCRRQRTRAVGEAQEESVAGVLDHFAPALVDHGANAPVVPALELLPGVVADELREIG